MSFKARPAALAAAGLVAAALVGCGNSDSSSDSASAKAATAGGGVVAQAKRALARDYAGTDRPLPASGPKAQPGKTVWILSCTQSGPSCAIPAAGALEAAKTIGWKAKVIDGKVDPTVYNATIRSAIAAKVDGIVLDVVDCALVQGSLRAAKAAGIKVYGLYSLDCDDKYAGGGKPMFDGTLVYGGGTKYADYMRNDYGRAIADYAIAATNGNAKIVQLKSLDTAVVRHLADGFEAEIAKCAGCAIYTKVFTLADFLSKLQEFTSAMLTQHPDANVVMAPSDAAVLLGMGAAVQQAKAQGRKLILLGGEGLPPNVKLIRAGVQTMAAGAPGRWAGWAAIDGLNRVFAGQPQVDPGIGHQTITKTRNLPAPNMGYDGNSESKVYADNYKRIWGIGG